MRVHRVAGARIVGQRHLLVPDLRNDRIQAKSARIARTAGAGRRLISGAADRHRKWIEIVGNVGASGILDLNHAGSHEGSRNEFIDGGRIGEPVAFIVYEEVGLAAPELRRQRSAQRAAEAVAVRRRKRRVRQSELGVRRMIVAPEIRGADVGSEIVFINGAVKLIAAALGHHLDLAAGRAAEIGSLVRCADFELFDAFDRRRDDAGWRAARRSGTGVAIGGYIRGRIAGHVIAVVAAIQLEDVLIGGGSRHVPRGRNTDLKDGERRRVTAQVGQQDHRRTRDRGSDRRVHHLQVRASGSLHLHRGSSGADLQRHIHGERQSYIDGLRGNLRLRKALLTDDDVIRSRRDARKTVAADVVRRGVEARAVGLCRSTSLISAPATAAFC